MQILIKQYRNVLSIKKMLVRYQRVAHAQSEIPDLDPLDWFSDPGGGPNVAKLHVVSLYPHPDELQGYTLAAQAISILERRSKLNLNWVVGYSIDSARIKLFISPWAQSPEGGRRKWYWIDPDSLAALRATLSVARKKTVDARTQEREQEREQERALERNR